MRRRGVITIRDQQKSLRALLPAPSNNTTWTTPQYFLREKTKIFTHSYWKTVRCDTVKCRRHDTAAHGCKTLTRQMYEK